MERDGKSRSPGLSSRATSVSSIKTATNPSPHTSQDSFVAGRSGNISGDSGGGGSDGGNFSGGGADGGGGGGSSATAPGTSDSAAGMGDVSGTPAASASQEYGFYVKLPPRRRRKPSKLDPTVDDSGEKSQANDPALLAEAQSMELEPEEDLDASRKIPRDMVMVSRASSRASTSSTASGTSGVGSSVSPGSTSLESAAAQSASSHSSPRGGSVIRSRVRPAKSLERFDRRGSSRPAGLHTPSGGSTGGRNSRSRKESKEALSRKVQALSVSEGGPSQLEPSGNAVLDFLRANNLEACFPLFQKEDIDFETLQGLQESDLEKIGVEKLGTRRKIMRAIVALESGPMGGPMGVVDGPMNGSIRRAKSIAGSDDSSSVRSSTDSFLQSGGSAFRPIPARSYSHNDNVFRLASSTGTLSGDETGSASSYPR